MVQTKSQMNPDRYLRWLAQLAKVLPRYAPDLSDPMTREVHVEIFNESLFRFTETEFYSCFKGFCRTSDTFPFPRDIISSLVDIRLSQDVDTAWNEAREVLESYRTDPANHRTCSEVVARTLNSLGTLKQLASNEERFLRKGFFDAYHKVKIKFVEDESLGNIKRSSKIGQRIAVPHGSDKHCYLPSPVETQETHEDIKKASPSEKIRSFLAGQDLPDDQSQNQGCEEKLPEKLNFKNRLKQVALENGWIEADQMTQDFSMSDLPKPYQKALAWCHSENRHLGSYSFASPSKGWFSKGWPMFDKFNVDQDPLLDPPLCSFITEEDFETDLIKRIERKSPEKAEITKRKLEERKGW